MICEEAICDLCIYLNKKSQTYACDKEPPNDIRNALAANHGYCRYFTCRYDKEGLCKKNK